jgi:phosphatidylinositol glycan class U
VHEWVSTALFIGADLVIAWLIGRICAAIRGSAVSSISTRHIVAFYLFNPFTIFSCTARSISLFSHLAVALVLYNASVSTAQSSQSDHTMRSRPIACGLSLALAVHLDFYAILLIVPCFCMLKGPRSNRIVLAKFLAFFILGFAALYATVDLIVGSKHAYFSQLEFIFTVPDLSPNVGVFWYFFTEVFDRFRPFFLFLFQAHMLVYIAPLAVCFHTLPTFLFAVMLSIGSIFKSYPSVSDVAFAAAVMLSCLPPAIFAFLRVRHLSIAAIAFCVCVCVGRTGLYLWLGAGSGNANFLYFQTLVYNGTATFALLDCLTAARKYVYATQQASHAKTE